jgi:hypothetical protein
LVLAMHGPAYRDGLQASEARFQRNHHRQRECKPHAARHGLPLETSSEGLVKLNHRQLAERKIFEKIRRKCLTISGADRLYFSSHFFRAGFF